jgi:hypothetical protein
MCQLRVLAHSKVEKWIKDGSKVELGPRYAP